MSLLSMYVYQPKTFSNDGTVDEHCQTFVRIESDSQILFDQEINPLAMKELFNCNPDQFLQNLLNMFQCNSDREKVIHVIGILRSNDSRPVEVNGQRFDRKWVS